MTWLGAVLFLQLLLSVPGRRVDLTLQRDAAGADVVRGVLSKMEMLNTFEEGSTQAERQVDEQFMREMSYVESQDGAQYPLDDPDGGIWRMSREILEETQRYNYPQLLADICRIFCIEWSNVRYSDLRMPLYSGLTVRMYLFHLHNTSRGLPETALDEDRAGFWARHFGENKLPSQWLSLINQLRLIEVCRIDTDVVFVLDSSGSIGYQSFQTVKDYAYNFTEGLLNGDTRSRVSIILYSTTAYVQVPLNYLSFNREQTLLQEIRNLTYISRATNTPEALCLLRTMQWRRSVSVLRTVIVLTDGRANRFSHSCNTTDGSPGTVNSTAMQVHNLHPPVTVFAVGVANYVPQELEAIASNSDLVDTLESFDYRLLAQNQRSRTYFICFKESQPVREIENESGEIAMDSVSRFRFSGPSNEGVTVRICIESGVIVVHGSYSIPNPSAVLSDFSRTLRAAEGEVAAGCFTSYTTLEDVQGSNEVDGDVSDTCMLCGGDTSPGGERGGGGRGGGNAEEMEVVVYMTLVGGAERGSQFSLSTRSGAAFECAADSCGENEVLVRRDGSCLCECMQGYQRDVEGCINIDECAVMPELCSGAGEMCADTDGNYTCECQEDYQRNGQDCVINTTSRPESFDPRVYAIVIGALSAVTVLGIIAGLVGCLLYAAKKSRQ